MDLGQFQTSYVSDDLLHAFASISSYSKPVHEQRDNPGILHRVGSLAYLEFQLNLVQLFVEWVDS